MSYPHATHKRFALVALVLGLLAPVARPAEPAARVAPGKSKFRIHGGTCTRSWQQRAVHDSISAACWQAEALRKQGLRIEVSTGKAPAFPFAGAGAAAYTVCQNPCRGWRTVATTDTFWQAALAAASLGKGSRVEIVAHYPEQ